MAKAKVVTEWRNIPILSDGRFYYVDDGFGELIVFRCEDDAINYIETGEVM